MDKQAAARVWRDGQPKRCFIYRFLAAGTIEEKVYQRQLSKEGLQDVLGGAAQDAAVSSEELRDLFNLRPTLSDTHDHLDCDCNTRGDGGGGEGGSQGSEGQDAPKSDAKVCVMWAAGSEVR